MLGAIGTFGKISNSLESLTETASLAVNNDPLGQPASVSVSGDALIIDGPLALGTAARVIETLARSPNLKTISISSIGGRMAEADLIAAEIKKRSLNTIVNGHCESACTFVLIAGTQRIASFGSSIGFHQPTYPGLDSQERAAMIKASRVAYLDAGLPRTFVTKALQSGPEEMWYPQLVELFDAGVYNAFDTHHVIEDNLGSAAGLNRRAPTRIDDITTLESAKADGKILTFNYRVSLAAAEFDLSSAKTSLFQINSKIICAKPLIPEIFSAGGVYRFVYLDPQGRTIADFQVDQC